MNTKSRILWLGAILTVILTGKHICGQLGFGPKLEHNDPVTVSDEIEQLIKQEKDTVDYFVDDSLYRWDEQLFDWIPVQAMPEYQAQLVTYNETEQSTEEPTEIAWKALMNIRYRLRYFSELESKIYAPVFPRSIRSLDGKEVVIEGFVIPLDEDEEILALSANPYASCFFCGQASPASVMSMYLKNESGRYKMDDFIKFRGTLHLNNDNPYEFYYILRDAEEE